ncbi:division/cell wall cluster transcriptional repressor MraZ [Gemmatimonadota bacterium]
MPDFLGQYNYSLDEKGRVSVPAKFRRELMPETKETFVVTIGHDKCLFVYPIDRWEQKASILRDQPMSDEKSRKWVRMFASSATYAVCDKQGRIMLPPNLMKWARLDRDVVINGMLDHIEIWAPDVFATYSADMEDEFEKLAEDVLF